MVNPDAAVQLYAVVWMPMAQDVSAVACIAAGPETWRCCTTLVLRCIKMEAIMMLL